jgi:hypothetical protein
VTRATIDAAPARPEGRRVALGRVLAVYSAVCSLVGLGIYLALGLHERLFADWVLQITAFGLLIAALCWPLIPRQPRNRAVWALLWVAVFSATQAAATGLLQLDLAALGRSSDPANIVPAELPLATALVHQTASSGWVAGNFAFVFALLLFPDGRLPSPRWRTAAWGVTFGGAYAVTVMAWTARPGSSVTPMADDFVAALSRGGQLAMSAAMAAGLVAVVVAFTALIVRYRQSTGQVRAQLRWIAWATALLVVDGLVLFPLMYASPGNDHYRYTSMVTFSIFLGAYVVAISRYRLYEIDRLISRTVGYGIVTALLAGVYVSSVLAAQAVVGTSREDRSSILVAGSTLLVAALFGPVRRRTQELVDRRFNRRVRDGWEVVAAFGERLRDDITLGTLADELRQATATVAQPSSVGIWVPARGGGAPPWAGPSSGTSGPHEG